MNLIYTEMRIILFIALFTTTGLYSSYAQIKSSIIISRLRCEYLEDPCGLDSRNPRLSWELLSNERNKTQTAFQLLVASDSLLLLNEKRVLWNSGKIKTGQTNQVSYRGSTLHSRQVCYWSVRVWDEKGNPSAWSPVAHWSMGLLNPQDWKAKWIGAPEENIPLTQQYYVGSGYHSALAASPEDTKWVIIDLGKSELLNALQLYPAIQGDSCYLFPERFRVDVSDQKDFARFKQVINETKNDLHKKDTSAWVHAFTPVAARYIRIFVTRLPAVTPSQYGFALAECKVLYKNKNLALHAAVQASDHLIYGEWQSNNWKSEYLVDGFTKPNTSHINYSLPVPPSPLLRKTFIVTHKIKKATLYATALGFYTIRLNGKKASDHELAPEWTDYHTRVQYQTYDVTRLLKQGSNAIGAMLADGWYAGAIFSHPDRGSYGFDRCLLAQLEIVLDNGSVQTISTDDSWKLLSDGPVQQASIFDGETFDAHLKPAHWAEPGFDDSGWKKVTRYPSPHILLVSQQNEPIKVIKEIKPIHFFETPNGSYIFDIGQNIAGWCRLSLPYNPGQPLTLRYAEVLQDDSSLYTENLRTAKQTDRYIPSGENEIVYAPQFTYHGFRYVEVSGLTRPPDSTTLTGCVMASSVSPSGELKTSAPLLNKLWSNIVWTQMDNMPSVPTDCPQRDERAGWMGDAQVFSQSAIYNMDMAAFFTKWIRDIYDSQLSDGRFPDFSPQVGDWMAFYNSPGWSDAAVILPWRLYQNYNDTAILATCYSGMKKYISFVLKQNPDLIWRQATGNRYGDWLNGNTIVEKGYPKNKGMVPNDVYATAFFRYSTGILARIAKVLGKEKESSHYDSLSKEIKAAFIKNFVDENGKIKGDTQAGYALALAFDLLPDSLTGKAASQMADAVREYDYRISTGIQSTIRLMNQLTLHGYNDIAYRLLESRRFPSWLYSIDQGATTIWERWDGYVKGRGFQDKGMNSFNHYAIGSVAEWMYRNILGINNDPKIPGYRHIILRPIPGGSLQWATGNYHSINGGIGINWKKETGSFDLKVEVPVNTKATVMLPAGRFVYENNIPINQLKDIRVSHKSMDSVSVDIGSGLYHFEVIF